MINISDIQIGSVFSTFDITSEIHQFFSSLRMLAEDSSNKAPPRVSRSNALIRESPVDMEMMMMMMMNNFSPVQH